MKQFIVVFKSGKEIKVSQNVANLLQKRICSGVAETFQTFTNKDDKNNVLLIINISDIACLYDIGNVI